MKNQTDSRQEAPTIYVSTGSKLAFFVLLLFLIQTLSSCWRTTTSVQRQDFSKYYQDDKQKALPSYVLYNLNDSVSRLYFTIKSTDLLYERDNNTNQLTAHILLSYVLHPMMAEKTVTDSGHIVLNDINESAVRKQLAGLIDFDVPMRGKYYLEITLRDLNKMSVTYEILFLDQSNLNSQNSFLLTEPGSETPKFRNWVDDNEAFNIRFNKPVTTKLYVKYFSDKTGPARPPYAPPVTEQQPVADSTFTIDISHHDSIRLHKEGWYMFSSEENSNSGMIVCRFPSGFPSVTTPIALLEPLRYITTKNEYQTIEKSRNLKVGIDSFWLSTGGSEERARQLISAFYGRVEIANRHFTSHCEGWKHDRGMIYLIYGEPEKVYRSPKSETWVYGQDPAGNMLSFVFNRDVNAPLDNEYKLERSQSYSISWMQGVDYWKQGQVYKAR